MRGNAAVLVLVFSFQFRVSRAMRPSVRDVHELESSTRIVPRYNLVKDS